MDPFAKIADMILPDESCNNAFCNSPRQTLSGGSAVGIENESTFGGTTNVVNNIACPFCICTVAVQKPSRV
jgi:hypothetical protein